ncbi:MAG: hypothetical protein IPG04_39445, partial [Polyangiaceae bacterium]|nr:hypothetical protein [Polyangiaceae bacterium]
MSRETHPTGTEELLEVTPEAIDEDAAELEDGLGAIATPPHAGAVEPDTDEVTYPPPDDSAGDVEVLSAQARVLQPSGVLAEVRRDLGEHFSPVLVAGAGDGGRFERCLDDRGDLGVLAMPKAALLLGDPRLKVLALAPSAAA